MKRITKEIWFPKKQTIGWGWRFPVKWQGWIVLLVYLCSLFYGTQELLGGNMVSFLVIFTFSSLLLTAVCYLTGEDPGPLFGKKRK